MTRSPVRPASLRSLAATLALSWPVLLAGCPGDPPTVDAGVTEDAAADAGADAPSAGCTLELLSGLRFSLDSVGVVPGGVHEVSVGVTRDHCDGIEVTLTPSMTGIATVPATVSIPRGSSSASIDVTGVAVGTITRPASLTGPARTAEGHVVAPATDGPPCPGNGGGSASSSLARVGASGRSASGTTITRLGAIIGSVRAFCSNVPINWSRPAAFVASLA